MIFSDVNISSWYLHNDFQFAYKYFTRQKIVMMSWITELERILYEQKKCVLVQKDSEINLFWFCIIYQSISLITYY